MNPLDIKNRDTPAYPSTLVTGNGATLNFGGLTKREYFAIHAPGIDPETDYQVVADSLDWDTPPFEEMTRAEQRAWWMRADAKWKALEADALLEALEKTS